MKALLLLASGAVLMFCLIVLLVSGVLVVRNEKAPKGGESHQPASLQTLERQHGRALTPPPSQRIEAGARARKAAGPLDRERNDRKVLGRSRTEVGSPDSAEPVRSETAGVAPSPAAVLDCAGQIGHNFGPCPGHVSLVAGVQSPGDGGAAGTSGEGTCR